MFKPKKAIPFLATGLALSGCGDADGNQDQKPSEELAAAVEAFCLQLDTCYPGYLAEGACVAYYSAYLDSIELVRGDKASECLAVWETVFDCYASSTCEESQECEEVFDEDENGQSVFDVACGTDDGASSGGSDA